MKLIEQLEHYASRTLYSEILKLCQEKFSNEKGGVSLQVRLVHMIAKLALFDVSHVNMHLSQLSGIGSGSSFMGVGGAGFVNDASFNEASFSGEENKANLKMESFLMQLCCK